MSCVWVGTFGAFICHINCTIEVFLSSYIHDSLILKPSIKEMK